MADDNFTFSSFEDCLGAILDYEFAPSSEGYLVYKSRAEAAKQQLNDAESTTNCINA